MMYGKPNLKLDQNYLYLNNDKIGDKYSKINKKDLYLYFNNIINNKPIHIGLLKTKILDFDDINQIREGLNDKLILNNIELFAFRTNYNIYIIIIENEKVKHYFFELNIFNKFLKNEF